ncbi:metallophosphoesterase [Streptomyces sp. NPDC002138]|uniref:metallophosphoesterase n=1 Tax=Streptomyces sp. NPDC002138 TaxID=3154410 RepID=UPI003322388E
MIFALVALAVLALLVLVHRWLWIRLVRDTTAPGGWPRRVLTGCAVGLPVLSVAALVAGRAGAPFWVQRGVAWPGFMWLAVLLYLSLAMLVAEPARLLLLRHPRPTPADASIAGGAGVADGPPAQASSAAPLASGGASIAGGAGVAAGRAGESVLGSGVSSAGPLASGGASIAGGAGVVSGEAGFVSGGAGIADGPAGELRSGSAAALVAPTSSASPAFEAPPEAKAGGRAEGQAPAPQASPAIEAPPEATRAGAAQAARGVGSSRRVFVARVLAGAAVAAAGGTVGYGTYGVLRGPRVKRVTVPLAKLPRAAHGFRIAVVSDIHLGPILGRAHTTRIVDTVNATQPDLIAIVGDLVDGSVHDLGPAAEPLARLTARHGSFFVTGNHEYFSGARQWVDHVRELGLHPLENARQELPYFDLAGVNDVAGESEGEGPDFDKALGGRDRADRTAVLLAHQPIVIHDAVRHGVDLQLSGHTHGGQLWPGNYLAELANPTVAGLERYGDTQLYVSRGAGAWGPPVRVGAPSDITVVQLASYQT